MTVQCNSCGADFETFTELAQHITISPKRTHKYGRVWAAKLLTQVTRLNKKQESFDRIPLSEEDKENRRELKAQVKLSGEKSMVNTICPKCKTRHVEVLEVEYARSPLAWRTAQNGTLIILCAGCRR